MDKSRKHLEVYRAYLFATVQNLIWILSFAFFIIEISWGFSYQKNSDTKAIFLLVIIVSLSQFTYNFSAKWEELLKQKYVKMQSIFQVHHNSIQKITFLSTFFFSDFYYISQFQEDDLGSGQKTYKKCGQWKNSNAIHRYLHWWSTCWHLALQVGLQMGFNQYFQLITICKLSFMACP